jgi:Big-like domain-containing protein/lysyl oxidase
VPLAFRRLVGVTMLAVALLAATAQPAWSAPAGTTHYPDLQTIIPTSSFSVVQAGTTREFRYTHLVYNNGPGPLEIQPQYNQASGTYRGEQQLFTHDAAGSWSLIRQLHLADAFVFHPEHGHFHFPLASFGLYSVAQDGGVGAPIAVSPKNGFCIADSYIYAPTVAHAGFFFGSQGSCADPSTLRGLSVAGADEYDYRDPGQAIPINSIPDGTYWFRATSDPNNDFVELDESNNETDVKLTIANGQVTAGAVTHPNTTPPAISLTAPADGARVSGTVTLSSDTPVTFGGAVQFLVDGNPIGSATQASSPYTFGWDTTAAVDGEHWLAARTTDVQGRTNTSAVAAVTVSNSVPPPPPPGGVLAIDGTVSQDGSSTLTTPPLSSTKTGDLLLAFVASDGPMPGGQTVAVSGGGLSWSLVRRANSRLGTSEIWKAVAPGKVDGLAITSTQANPGYHQSVTLTAFASSGGVGASSSAGAATGAPRTTVTTTVAGSWVFGVGNDWDRAVARTPGTNQIVQHQWVDASVGDTFWVQSQANPTATSGSAVAIDDTAPTTDQWNLAAVEVLPGSPPPPPPLDTTPPQVSVTDPPAGAKVGGIVSIGATASDNVGVQGVQFRVDGQPVGAKDNSPPFLADWDTRTASQGQHTITAEATDAAGNVGASVAVAVSVDNSAPPPAVISIDKLVFTRATGTLRSPALTTTAAGERLAAFVAHDGPNSPGGQRSTVTGAGLTWTLVKRSNTQAGDAEIWTAKATGTLSNAVVTATPLRTGYDGLLTVVAFRNAAGTGVAGAAGAPSGAPDIYLPGVAAGSWVFAVGNDWDRAVARQPVGGQVLQQQWVDTRVGDTFWVQSTTVPNAAPGLATIHDSAPTTDRWNYAAVEVTASSSG